MTMNSDNQLAIALMKDNKFHSWTKHISLCYHFVREAVENDKINIKYILTEENVADIFTKALASLRPKFIWFVEMLELWELKKKEM